MKNFIHSKTLRQQMIVSHLLPVVIAAPILLLLAYYSLRTHTLMRDTVETVIMQSEFITGGEAFTPNCEEIPECSAKLIKHIRPQFAASVILLNDGKAIGFRGVPNEDGSYRLERYVLSENLSNDIEVLDMDSSLEHSDGRTIGNKVNIIAPILKKGNPNRGLIRLTFGRDYFSDKLVENQLRIAAAVISVLLLSMLIGSLLGTRFSSSLKDTTDTIISMARGKHEDVLPEMGSVELRELAAAVNDLNEKLNASRESRRCLKAYLSHELGRPLGALSSATDALQRGAAKDDELCQLLTGGMKTEIKQLNFLIGQLRLSNDDADTGIAAMGKVRQVSDPLPLLKNAAVYWGEFAAAKNLRFETDFPESLPWLALDQYAITQMIGNLISNAVKFTDHGGSICLRAGSDDDSLWIELSDTGQGISEEDLAFVCDPYFRGGTASATSGMGLGLSIVKSVVAAHDGTFTLSSEIGKGTKARIVLPIRADLPAEDRNREPIENY